MTDHSVVTGVRRSVETTSEWHAAYSRRLIVTDLLALIWVVFGVQLLWFGFTAEDVRFRGSLADVSFSYSAATVVVIALWMGFLSLFDSRSDSVVGAGSLEYKSVANASIRLFGLLAIVAYLFHIDIARGYVLLAFPLGIVVLIFSRWLWRRWLHVQRLNGRFTSRAVLAGSVASVTHIAKELTRQPEIGYRVAGACISAGRAGQLLADTSVPVLGGLNEITDALDAVGADTVIITSSDDLSPQRVRELGWRLEPKSQNLVVAPSLTGIGGPRIHTRPVAGLPLIHVEAPEYTGRRLWTKRVFDVLASGVLIALLSPVFLCLAVAVKLSSPGGVLFKQSRLGLNGKPFKMLKFRSMVADAESRLDELEAGDRDAGNAILFKMRNDPRVTRLGRFLRRFSLDELPQLFNVFAGSMSLVGPRPSLDREAAQYEDRVRRRFFVKPGITGLWQVSGRSNLSWEDTVRLDLYYVENWSLMGDLMILWRTLKAVAAKDGAF